MELDTRLIGVLRRAIVIVALLLVLSFAYSVSSARSSAPSIPRSADDEQVFCASAVCFYDDIRGKECLDFIPRISKLIPVADASGDSVRLVIEATGRECSKER